MEGKPLQSRPYVQKGNFVVLTNFFFLLIWIRQEMKDCKGERQ